MSTFIPPRSPQARFGDKSAQRRTSNRPAKRSLSKPPAVERRSDQGIDPGLSQTSSSSFALARAMRMSSRADQKPLGRSPAQTRLYLFALRQLHKQIPSGDPELNLLTGREILGFVVKKLLPVNSHILIGSVLDC